MEKLILALPPSVNEAYINNRFTRKRIYSSKAREWFLSVEKSIKRWKLHNQLNSSFTDYFYADIDFYLTQERADSHNYKKLLFDALEKNGIFSNDKYILDRTQFIGVSSVNPRVEITFEKYEKRNNQS